MTLVGTRSLKEGRETAGAKGMHSSPGCGHQGPVGSNLSSSTGHQSSQKLLPRGALAWLGSSELYLTLACLYLWSLLHLSLLDNVHPQLATTTQRSVSDSQVFIAVFILFLGNQLIQIQGRFLAVTQLLAVLGKSAHSWSRGAPGPSKLPQFIYTQSPCSIIHQGLQTQMPLGTQRAVKGSRPGEDRIELGEHSPSSWLLSLRNVWQCFHICQFFGRSWKPDMWHLPSPNLKTLTIARGNRTAQACEEKRCTPL